MVGASGFEPPASWSRTRRASQAALRPENQLVGFPRSLRCINANRNPANRNQRKNGIPRLPPRRESQASTGCCLG